MERTRRSQALEEGNNSSLASTQHFDALWPKLSLGQRLALESLLDAIPPNVSIGITGSCLYTNMSSFGDIDLIGVADEASPQILLEIASTMGFENTVSSFGDPEEYGHIDLVGSWHLADPSLHIELMSRGTFKSILELTEFPIWRLKQTLSRSTDHSFVSFNGQITHQTSAKGKGRYRVSRLSNILSHHGVNYFGPNYERAILANFERDPDIQAVQELAWDKLSKQFAANALLGATLPFYGRHKFSAAFERDIWERLKIGR